MNYMRKFYDWNCDGANGSYTMNTSNETKLSLYNVFDYFKFRKYVPFFDYLKFYNNHDNKKHYSYLFGKRVKLTTPIWYLHNLLEIFDEEPYKFSTLTDSPFIIDCGANLGMSLIHFKRQYPRAKIIAFEPDPTIFNCLKFNCNSFGFTNVTLYEKAIWNEHTTLEFSSEKALGGCISSVKEKPLAEKLKVETTTLLPYLQNTSEPIDFLKIDIEGAEYVVLDSIRNNLSNVEKIFIEYHGNPGEPQSLPNILMILKEAGFRLYITEGWKNMRYPFVECYNKNFLFDLQLNIFGYRK